ncbi:gas vesicle accessory protein GvpU [Celeribacter halophilus]|jgi:hypothetical protein|uniref:gas vesicle accessory protein GvpU n=1 Tax=Celeribacter halophilus TaxID=576117 RepID=UPI003A9038CC
MTEYVRSWYVPIIETESGAEMVDKITIENDETAQSLQGKGNQDWFLENTISGIISLGVEFGITLTVNGLIISGTLINGKTYFEELSKSLKSASKEKGDFADVIGEQWAGFKAIYEDPDEESENKTPSHVSFIHLKNAHIFAPGQQAMPTEEGILWRGKLSSVDGFTIGVLSKN